MATLQQEEGGRNNKRGLFDESGLTEEERRRIRSKQRLLHEKIEGGPDQEEDVSKMEFLSKVRDENNEIFNSVRFTREAVLDAENAGLIVEKARLEVDKLRSVSAVSIITVSLAAIVEISHQCEKRLLASTLKN